MVRLLPIQLSCLIYYPFTNIGRVEVEKVRAAAKEELESAVAAVEARAAADAAAQVDKVRTEARAELEREVAALQVAGATDAAAQVEAAVARAKKSREAMLAAAREEHYRELQQEVERSREMREAAIDEV